MVLLRFMHVIVSSNSKYIKARSRKKFKLFRLENKHKKIIVVASFVIAMCFHGQLANYWNTTTFYFDLGLTEQHQQEERSNDKNTKNNNDNKNANGDNDDLQTTTLLGGGNKYNGGANLLRSTERREGDKFLEDVARNNSFANFVDSFMSTNGDFANSEHLTKFSEQERVVIQMNPPSK